MILVLAISICALCVALAITGWQGAPPPEVRERVIQQLTPFTSHHKENLRNEGCKPLQQPGTFG